MRIETWLRKKVEEFKNDPEYLKEYINMLEGELEAVKKKGLELAFDVAVEAHLMGRAYNKGGEVYSPGEVMTMLEDMARTKFNEVSASPEAPTAEKLDEPVVSP